MRGWVGWSDSKSWFDTKIDLLCKVFFGAILCGNSNGKIVSGQILGKYNKCFAKRRQPKQASFSIGAPSDAEGSLTVLLLWTSFKWHYMAVAGAGAGAEIMDKAGAENK